VTERRLWAAGVLAWPDFASGRRLPLAAGRVAGVRAHLEESAARLARRDAAYFGAALPSDQLWRLFPAFADSVAYLDIETTGLGPPGDHITTIALYDGRTVRHYVHGQSLERFGDDVQEYRLLVTYNGKTFDAPFIRSSLGIQLDQAHIDLRYVLAALGYKGGLKGCERQLGLDRGDLDGVDGYTAVLLWQEYLRTGRDSVLENLLCYNVQDVLHLEVLMALAYNRRLADTPFAVTHRLPVPPAATNPFRADRQLVERLLFRSRGLVGPWAPRGAAAP
jgi:uncharacterized protein YprB with RNaseH-like and TPR domain